jgi:VCBS repeat-containing protein
MSAVDDFFDITEDDTISGNLFDDNGLGPDVGTLSIVEVDGVTTNVGELIILASGALLVVNADGSIAFNTNSVYDALSVGESITEFFSYTVEDTVNGGFHTAFVTITINGANDLPLAFDDDFSTDEDTILSASVLIDNGFGADSDVDALDVLTVTQVDGAPIAGQITLASGALLTMNSDGTFSYDPNGAFDNLQVGQSGIDSFTYTIDDGNGGTSTAAAVITINGVNDAPVAAADAVSTTEDTAGVGNVLLDNGGGVDSDVESDPLTVSEVNGSAANLGAQIALGSGALLTLNANGSYEYDPNGAFESLADGDSTTDSFTYTISDGNGGSDSATVTMTIAGVNDAPVGVADTNSTDEDTAISGNVLLNDTDVDTGAILSVSAVNGVAANVDTQITLASGALLTLNSDGSYDYDPNGSFEGLQNGESATDSFSYTVSDGQGGSDTATATITINGVNDAPVANDDGNSTDEANVAIGNVITNDTDVDNDPQVVTEINGVAANVGVQITLASGALVTLNSDGSYIYNPNGAFEHLGVTVGTATDSFTYTLSDTNGGTDTATVSMLIAGINDAPVALADTASTDENTNVLGNVLTNDTDVDTGDVLSVNEVNGVAANVGAQITLASGALLTLNANGSYDYNPNGAFEGLQVGESATDSFSYKVSDGLGGGTDTETVTITINGVNDAPVANDDGNSTDEANVAIGNVITNDTDVDNDPQVVTEINGVAANVGVQITLASGALVTLNSNGTYTYNPNGAFEHLGFTVGTATDSFTYTLSDTFGGTDTATVSMLIAGINDAPVALADTASTDENTSVLGNALTNDTDVDTGDVLTVSEVNGVGASVGTQIALASGALLTLNANGSYSYNPNGAFEDLADGQSTTDSFDYTVSDGIGGSDIATATITINGVNDAPVAVDDTNSTDENTAVLGNVLTNDTDVDLGDVLSVSAVNGVAGNVGTQITLASGALLTLNASGSYDYDPNGAFESLANGQSTTDSFNYTVSDGNGGSDIGTVTITINGVNDAPVAGADTNSTDEATAVLGNVLTNDTDVDSGAVLSVSEVNGVGANVGVQITLASGALLTLNANGSYSYDPNGSFESLAIGESTTDSFNYTVSDGLGGTDTATVTITINGANDTPVANADAGSTDEETLAFGNVLANDTDADASDTLVVSAVNGVAASVGAQITLASGALLTLNSDGSYEYDPSAFSPLGLDANASDSFTYTVSDGNGGTDDATVTINIASISTTITGDANANTLQGFNGNDVLVGLGGADVLDGGAGTDTADYSTATARVAVRLWNNSGTEGDAAGDTLSGIENLTGGAGGDTLAGDNFANVLIGGGGADFLSGLAGNDTLQGDGGADVLVGGAGADSLSGGAGTDTADYSTATARVAVRLWNNSGTEGDATGDTLSGIENLTGGAGNDTLAGDGLANILAGGGGADFLNGLDGNDTLRGDAGADVLVGGAGADALDGGNDSDTANYSASAAGVQVNLGANTALNGDAQDDTFISIENLIGSGLGDILIGNNIANALSGLAGDDTLDGQDGDDALNGGAGADTLAGGAGSDTADYSTATARVAVRLWNNSGTEGDATGDTLSGIENLTGGAGGDTLAGDSFANILAGGGGADFLNGLDGNDTLRGDAGADVLNGGAGSDTADYSTATARVAVRLWSNSGSEGDATGDTLSGVENVTGGAGGDTIAGDSFANVLVGGGGADFLNGLDGNDTLRGDAGNDVLVGGAGADAFVFSVGGGADQVNDFDADAAGGQDTLDVSALGVSALDFGARVSIVDQGANTLVTIDGVVSMLLLGVTGDGDNVITQSDFIFGP